MRHTQSPEGAYGTQGMEGGKEGQSRGCTDMNARNRLPGLPQLSSCHLMSFCAAMAKEYVQYSSR